MPQDPADAEALLRAARAKLIRDERARQGLTQDQVARLTEHYANQDGCEAVSRVHLAQIEKGRSGFSEAKLRGLAKALGVKEARLRNPQAELWQAA
jgi:transcriptional regulator with XRE-family HTH domain